MSQQPEFPGEGFSYLSTLPPWDHVSPFAISTPRKLLAALGHPQDRVKAIHVGGTNGKGTVCSLLSAMFHQAGYVVGQIASPHLSHINERTIIEGSPAAPEKLNKMLLEVKQAAARLNVQPSAFEAVIAASFLLFSESKLDWMIVEVGLGGRLDATNTMRCPQAAVITSIGWDHMGLLGDSLAAIATEKAGIFRSRVPAFVGKVNEEARAAISQAAFEIGCPVEWYGESFSLSPGNGFKSESGKLSVPAGELHLLAEHQFSNAALACRVAQFLGLTSEYILQGMAKARWPGRLESFSFLQNGQRIRILVDGAHNPDGISALGEFLNKELEIERDVKNVIFVFSVLKSKAWKEMLAGFESLSDELSEKGCNTEFIFTEAKGFVSVPAGQLQQEFKRGSCAELPKDAFNQALANSDENTLVVITGSLYLLGAVRPLLTQEPFRTIDE